ncbi:MAG: DUF2202 domain-containing protein [Methanotrichaceae archaeon]|nr:DUF2202 domain-containing protein [Methanotrichaceae archaeon]
MRPYAICGVALMAVLLVMAGSASGAESQDITSLDIVSIRDAVAAIPAGTLNESEEAGLLYMREEEKLARDVYLALASRFSQPIFGNIAASEQTHMDSVKLLLDKYELLDPDTGEAGVFVNPQMQTLYDQLSAAGTLEDSLKTGATIEELDIFDLQERLDGTDNEDVILVYEALMRGSRNHLRSFSRNMDRFGYSYDPQYLSQDEYEAIVESPMERGPFQV